MKTKLIALFALLASPAAFASVYQCQLLSDSHGHHVYGAPGYAVDVNGSEAVLLVTRGVDEGRRPVTTEFKMKVIAHHVEGSVYEAQGVRANVLYLNGLRVTIQVGKYSASCSLR